MLNRPRPSRDQALGRHRQKVRGWREQAKGGAHELFGPISIEGNLASRAFERSPDFALPKAELTQGDKSLSVSFGPARGHLPAVGRAIRVTKHECSSAAALRNQTAAMQSSMVRGAQDNEPVGIVAPAFRARC